MTDPHRYCTDLVANPGSSLHYSLLFESAGNRQAIIAGHALVECLRNIAAQAERPESALPKLNWWTEELAALEAGRARHPVSQALLPCREHPLLRRCFPAMLGAVELAVTDHGFAEQAQLEHFAQALGGRLAEFEQGLHLGAPEATGDLAPQVRDLGRGLEMLQALRPGRERGMEHAWMLPGDLLHRHQVTDADLNAPNAPAGLRSALEEFAEQVHGVLGKGSNGASKLAPSLAARASIARATIDVMRRHRFDLLHRRLGISPLRKLWLSWRAQS